MSAATITDQVTLELEVAGVRYRSEDDAFAVLDALDSEGEDLVLTGAVGHVHEGETLTVTGRWREHPRYGRQLQATQVRPHEPTGERALLSYLASVRHVGPRGAAFLLRRHGAEVLGAVDRSPRRRLLEVPGIGAARITAAVASWEAQVAQRAARLFLADHGVEAAVAARIQRALGDGSIELLRADPYRITELVGVGFGTADALARALGTAPDAPARVQAGLLHALSEAEIDGHCHLPRAELELRAARLLELQNERLPDIHTAALAGSIDRLCAAGRLVCERSGDGEIVADASMHALQRRLAEHVRNLLASAPTLRLRRIERPRSGSFVPSDDQWHGVCAVLERRLSILTGGPGTGKSSAMRTLVGMLSDNRRRVRLCAPTGKAARRLAAATGHEASTIHRLLEWVPGEGFTRDAEHPLDEADVLIVDEASMLGVRLAEALLAAVGPRTHVLLVGDSDQLAPVGPGRVLEDLIASGAVPVTALHEVFRQAARSLIVRAAHAINHGQVPPTRGEGAVRDFFMISHRSASQIFAETVSLASERLPAHYGLDPRLDVQVLAPMRRGPVGIDALNLELRGRLNAHGEPVPGTPLRVGDRVIQTRNDHDHELMNGEVAMIVHHDVERNRVLLRSDDGRHLTLPLGALDTLRLAYAISIHKAQGSQAPAVIVALARSHSIMLTRNLLYTAVTRAERVCVLVGEPAALEIALARRDARRRHTRLAELVLGGDQV